VYGSLRKGFNSDAYNYISKYFSFVANAKVKGKLYDLGDYPAAIPTNENIFIVGELYCLKNENEYSWAMEQLDDYEGIHVEEGERPLYRREPATIILENKNVVAWIYWYNDDILGMPLITSGDVLEYKKLKGL
jgi:gamma-glutamylcyclotransferase (GGCT)/AIG2-like uncharacterized protein YtfP